MKVPFNSYLSYAVSSWGGMHVIKSIKIVSEYEGCSNMNASSFITFFTCMLQQYSKRFYKRLYVTFKLAPDLKKNTVYLSSYGLYNEGHVSILTYSILRTYTSDKDERLILRYSSEIS